MPILPSSARLTFVAAATLVTCSTHAFCQANPLDYVPNRPYTAQVVETDVQTRANGAHVQRETKVFEARDSQGRTWIESFQSNNMERPMVVNLYIPLRRQFIQLFPGQRTARVMTFPGTGPIPIHRNLHVVKTKTETLPGRTIHGIYAVGTRTTRVRPPDDGHGPDVLNVHETWISPDLKIVVFAKDTSTDPGSDQITTEIRQLDRSEPDSALFEIPGDYKIVEATTGPR
jgi:hypothetical protein